MIYGRLSRAGFMAVLSLYFILSILFFYLETFFISNGGEKKKTKTKQKRNDCARHSIAVQRQRQRVADEWLR